MHIHYAQVAAKQDPEDLILWSDGTSCFRYELTQMTHMSDDYEVIPYNTPRHVELTAQADFEHPFPANPGFCCSTCGRGFDFGCSCPDY